MTINIIPYKKLFLKLHIEYEKYNDLYILKTIYEESFNLNGFTKAYKIPVFGTGSNIIDAEINLCENIKALRTNSELVHFLDYSENNLVEGFDIIIQNFDKENNDFHLIIKAGNMVVHHNCTDFKKCINELYEKFFALT